MMTIAQLVAKLQQFDGSTPVQVTVSGSIDVREPVAVVPESQSALRAYKPQGVVVVQLGSPLKLRRK